MSFTARRIRDTLCQLQPATIAEISHAIVRHGQDLHEETAATVRPVSIEQAVLPEVFRDCLAQREW